MAKYLVVATPRSGTAYIAALLTRLGLDCGHERHLGLTPQLSAFVSAAETMGEASWLAVPLVDQLPPEVRIVHQVRNPLKVIRSMVELQFFDLDAAGEPRRVGRQREFTEYALNHCPQVRAIKSEIERAAWFYYHWNRRIEELGSRREILRVRLEELDVPGLRRLLTFVGVEASRWTDVQLAAELESVPTDTNSKPKEKAMLVEEVTWASLPGEVRELAQSYGYTVQLAPSPAASRPGASCDAAFEAAREHLYRAQWAWHVERDQQALAVAALSGEVTRLRGVARELQTLLHTAQVEHRKRVRELNTRLQQITAARRDAVKERDQTQVQLRAAERARDELRWQLEAAVTERKQLEAAAAAARANWRKARDDQRVLSATLRETRRVLDSRIEYVKRLRLAVDRYRNRNDVLTHQVEHLKGRVAQFKLLLEMRTQEVRYRLGEALLLAMRPSRDTLRLPGRLLGLLWDGMKKRRARRTPGAEPGSPVPLAAPTELATPAPDLGDEANDIVLREVTKPATVLALAERHNGNVLTSPPATPVGAEARRPTRAGERAGRRGYLFFCVNGAGLGHVTRSLAIARRIRRLEPDAPIYFLSSSQALDVISREGMVAYHIPPYSRFGDGLRTSEWSTLLQQQIQLIADTHHPAVFVYDGIFPYRGVLDAIQQCGFDRAVMVLRLRHKHDRLQELADKLTVFDEVIFPGEAGVSGGIEDLVPRELAALNCQLVDPIVYLDRDELLPRDGVRLQWNVPADKKLVYVQLGAGNINDIQELTDRVLSALAERKDVVALLAESPIAERSMSGRENVHVIRHYPNSLYCNGFDLAITAAGYNTFHEQIHFGVPSVLVPNEETKTDDQMERARVAHRALAAIAVLRPDALAEAIALGLTDATAATMREKALALVPRTGALPAAQRLIAAGRSACVPVLA